MAERARRGDRIAVGEASLAKGDRIAVADTRLADGDWIAVDWGTTSMRARLVSGEGAIRAEAPTGPGMGALTPDAFEPALVSAIGPWLVGPWLDGVDRPVDVLVCGMAGARQGWREAPYASVPAALDALLSSAITVPTDDARLAVRIVPGLSQADPPDVMRGEETQLLGLLVGNDLRDATVCLPGTHSKWVAIEDRRVIRFATHMTGEIFAAIGGHTILRHSLGADEASDDEAFDEAVREAREVAGAVLDRLFGLRAAGLLGDVSAGRARSRLSGLLIGAEIAVALGADRPGTVHVVAAGPLAARYGRALDAFGVHACVHDGGALAVAGLAAMRQSAG